MKFKTILLSGVLILAMTTTAMADGQAYVDGKYVTTTIIDDRMYVPVTEIAPILGGTMDYDSENNVLYVTSSNVGTNGKVNNLELYPNVVAQSEDGTEILKVYELPSSVNPEAIPKDAIIKNGVTYELAYITREYEKLWEAAGLILSKLSAIK